MRHPGYPHSLPVALLVCLLLLAALVQPTSSWRDHFGNERVITAAYDSGSGKTMILLLDGLLHEGDNATAEALGAQFNSSILSHQPRSPTPLVSLKQKDSSPDEVVRVLVYKSLYLPPPIKWLGLRDLGAMINPSIIKWHNRTVLCWKDAIEGPIQLRVLDHTQQDLQDPHSTIVFGSPRSNCTSNAGLLPWHFNGEDARLLINSKGNLHIFFTSHHEWNYRMFSSRAYLDPATRQVSFDSPEWFTVMEKGYMPRAWGRHQKNWVPFLHQERVLFVQNFNPLHVMEFIEDGVQLCRGIPGCGVPDNCTVTAVGVATVGSNQTLPGEEAPRPYSKTVSQADGVDLGGWEYGAPRGGTPAIVLPGRASPYVNTTYFALFHTRHHVPNNMLESYFMGGITWYQDGGGTFRILSVSRAPILNVSLYDGPWTPARHGSSKIDYVVFPLGLMLSEKDNDTLAISFGRQDIYGAISYVSLRSVLEGMVCVNTACLR